MRQPHGGVCWGWSGRLGGSWAGWRFSLASRPRGCSGSCCWRVCSRS